MTTAKIALEQSMVALRQDKAALYRESEGHRITSESLRIEKLALQQEAERLQGALSHVADTQDSARGLVVNLPDILFDVNEATLKPEAQLVLAKLAGILLILPQQRVLIEGHTDSSGSPEYNLDLSQRRALVVMELLQTQGIERQRLRSVGYGMQYPVVMNSTAKGRSKNRRVEIVIGDDLDSMAGQRGAIQVMPASNDN